MDGFIVYAVTNRNLKVTDRLGLSYRTPNELNNIIDKELPGRPQFKCQDLVIAGETLQFYYRDIIPCIRTLYGDPEFVRDLVFAPECHYTDVMFGLNVRLDSSGKATTKSLCSL